ncbi:MAG: diguanylate cyclase [Vallitaleaceae bacterium]|nr:diguanylate cyclase [Vallitaleaceae bacterium]
MIENKRRTLLLYLVFISFALVLSFLLIFTMILIRYTHTERLLLEQADETYKERELYLKDYLDMAEKNLLSIRNSTFFNDYLASLNDSTQLENYLLAYASSRSDFMKIRYLDKEGYERIRIEKDSYGSLPYIKAKNLLQDKSDRYFFIDSHYKTLEKVWFSSIDLNEENNQLETPNKPTIRAILPLSIENSFAGILIINYFMDDFLASYANTAQFTLSLFNDKGYSIYYGFDSTQSEQRSWGNSLSNGYNIQNELSDNPLVYHLNLPIQDGINLAFEVKATYLQQERENQLREYLTIFIAILIASLILTFFITRFLSRSLLNFDQVQHLYDSLIDATSVAKIGFWELDSLTQELKCNDSLNHIFEFSKHPGKMSFSDFLSYLPTEDQDMVQKKFANSLQEKQDFSIIHRLNTPSGAYRYVEERGKHIFDRKGKYLKSIGSIYDMTDKYLSEQKFKLLLDNASDGIFILDLEGHLIAYSQKSLELLGYTPKEMQALLVFDWDKSLSSEEWLQTMDTMKQQPIELERTHMRKDGSIYTAYITANLVSIENHTYIYSSVRDISKQKELQKAVEDTNLRWQFAIEGNKDGLWDWNVDTDEVYFSPQWKAMLGFEEHEITNSLEEWKKRIHPDDLKQVFSDVDSYFAGKTSTYVNEHRVLCKDGSYKWIRDRGIVITRNSDHSPHRMIGTHTDISDYVAALDLIKKQTYIDELTQLHNRKSYNERIRELLEQYHRYQIPFSMIMLDIDYFKHINDTYGHSTGDVVLQRLAHLLTEISRKNDYLFRIGGEEFVFLLTATTGEKALLFAEKARIKIQNELQLSEIPNLGITISLGCTEVEERDNVDTLFHKADQAMYKAKAKGRNQVCSS